ncbi:sigma-70 family RNA polymerase sigma factor [Flavitalea sp. BT771]|uniref:sigma-70 family RNA polymerase sigma factor n=1 Tax=Flavitalea sp. BT771 TaxID=3063329 RepID=UPI0026E3BFCB|nr:sigma-70 family RNA polymerase sigma factor [Flavitalea sp. BT771]MDO6430248.1 sigma-70 family RNA polymerase sigma factor [Flavitalea sp. BT771]MDV6219612.1 sigma-70 family RNA polymerase sigma factor [Flavitalea sp. BT771]
MTSPYIDDTTLLAGFHQRETLAEKQVFQKYFKPLCLYSETITGQLAASEDIVAESFEKAWARRLEFNTLENLKAFLYHIVRNASLNYTESQKRHRSHHEQIRYLSNHEPQLPEALEREILRVELLQEIYQEIENLPDRCGQIFKLLFIHHQTTQEIADQLSINVQTVRSQKARAIQLIKTELLRKRRIAPALLFAILLGYAR